MADRPPEREKAKLIQDNITLREQIVSIHLGWASLENEMALVLETTLGKSDLALGFAIYFTPNNAETRFSIVDNALRARIGGSAHESAIVDEWDLLIRKIHKARLRRNVVAHGGITTVYARGKNHVRLTPPIFDMARMQRKDGQLPGLSAHDVSAIANMIWQLVERVSLMQQAAEAWRVNDDATFQEKLLQLKAHRQKPGVPQ